MYLRNTRNWKSNPRTRTICIDGPRRPIMRHEEEGGNGKGAVWMPADDLQEAKRLP